MARLDQADEQAAIFSYLETEFGEASTFEVESIDGGNANETYLIQWNSTRYVLRCPPASDTAPQILHNIEKEITYLQAVEPTWVPAPRCLSVCREESVLGHPFYIMEYVDGLVFNNDLPETIDSPEHKIQISTEIIDTLAKIHCLDATKISVESEADPIEYTATHLGEMYDQLQWAYDVTSAYRELDRLFSVGQWLQDNIPETSEVSVVHGDFKPDNLLFDIETSPELVGVLDWEMAAIGNPLVDLGWLLSYWNEKRDPSPLTPAIQKRFEDHDYYPVLDVFVNDYSTFMTAPAFLNRKELISRYERQTGFEYDLEADRFYRAFGVFKLAVLCEGFYRTYVEGSPDAKDSYPLMELAVPTLAQQAHMIIEGDIPL